MSLTVPKAGVIAGRSADVRVAAPDFADTIAQFGREVQARGMKFQQERQAMDQRRTQLDIARDLGEARQEIEQTTDPDAIDSVWQTRSAEIRQKYLGPGEDGKPRYDERTAAELDLTFTELNDRHGLALGNRAINLRQSQREAAYVEFEADILSRAAVADPDTLGAYVEMGAAAIDDRRAAGSISPEEAARQKQALAGEIYGARAKQMIMDDPEGFLSATQPDEEGSVGEWAAMGSSLGDLRISAQKEVDRRAAAAAKDAEAAAKERTDAIGKRLDDMTGLFSKGFTVSDEGWLKDPEVRAHPKFAATQAAQSLRDEKPGIQTMTVAQLDAEIDAEMARPKTHAWEAERVNVLRQWRDEAAAKSDSDYVSLAQQTGQKPPELPDFDPANPGAFAEGLARRMSYDAAATEKGWTRTQAILSQDEKARLKTVLDPKSDPAPKLALAKSILAATGGRIDRVAGVLEADPVFVRAARTLSATGNPQLAESILRGQQKAQLGTVNLPSEKQMTSIFDRVTGGAFDGDVKVKAELIGAARALYADSAAGVNPDGADSVIPFMDDEEAQTIFQTSIQRVLGASADPNGGLTVGGLQEVNDRPVYLPAGVAVADVDQTMQNLGWHLQGRTKMNVMGEDAYGWPEGQAEPDRLRAFKAASIDGSAPNLGSDPSRTWSNLSLRRVGESDIYELTHVRNGRVYAVPKADDPSGRAWRFSLKELMREARK